MSVISRPKIASMAVGSILALFALQTAQAEEHFPPYQPGATTGTPEGALPPPGVYFSTNFYLKNGDDVNNSGHDIGVKIQGAGVTPALLWVPGITILGAQYGVAIAQPYALTNSDAQAIGGSSSISEGFYNLIIKPEELSWNLGHGNFISESLNIYLPTGPFHHTGTSTNAKTYANNFTTFEPEFAYSYLGHGWDITLNNMIDFNTTNNVTHYHSGDVYNLDWTVAHQLGHFTLGLIGSYAQQFTDDTHFGKTVPNLFSPGYGNRYMFASVGALLQYHIHKVTFSIRYLPGIAGANSGKPNFVHFGVSMPIS